MYDSLCGRLSLKWVIEIYKLMKVKDVVLYAGGKEGALALKTLDHEKIQVNAVADQCVGKAVVGRVTVSIAELCARGHEVCIFTSLQIPFGGEMYQELGKYFEIVIDNFIMHWMVYFFLNDIDELRYMSCFPFNHYESLYSQ